MKFFKKIVFSLCFGVSLFPGNAQLVFKGAVFIQDGGKVYSVDVQNSMVSVLQTFDKSFPENGYHPNGSLVEYGGKYWGLNSNGGDGQGTLYSIDVESNTFELEYSFQEGDGQHSGGITVINDKFYMIRFGLDNQFVATTFKLLEYDPLTSQVHQIYERMGSFFPIGFKKVILVNNRLWGVIEEDNQIIFSINTDGTDFNEEYSSSVPINGLILANEKFYGMTDQGGIHNEGSVFSYDYQNGQFELLHSFNDGTESGRRPVGDLAFYDNSLYGFTRLGGLNYGIVFKMAFDGSEFDILHKFTKEQGNRPFSNPVVLNSEIFGQTTSGGVSDRGTIFSIGIDGSRFKEHFDYDELGGSHFFGSLILDCDPQSPNLDFQMDSFVHDIEDAESEGTFELNVTTGSEGRIIFTSSNPEIVSINGQYGIAHAEGNVTLTAEQHAYGCFEEAFSMIDLQICELESPELTFEIGEMSHDIGGTFELEISSFSEGAVEFSSSNTEVISISGNIASVNGEGVTTLSVQQEKNACYSSQIESIEFHVCEVVIPTLLLDDIQPKKVGDPPFNLNATSNSPASISFSSSNEEVLEIADNLATIKSGGMVTLTASQESWVCFSEAEVSLQLEITAPLGNQIYKDLAISPNPFEDKIELLGINSSEVKIFDTSGRVILNQIVDHHLSTKNVKPGIYIIEVKIGTSAIRRKIVKK